MPIGEGASSRNQAKHTFVKDGVRVGFLTDPTLCIGCKACEVACKEWNRIPADGYDFTGMSYDNTRSLGASTWRHVMFIERAPYDGEAGGASSLPGEEWTFLSNVCKHCENAGCLEACPTGSIIRVENGAVFVQDDICNGCGYCVVSCPFGVIDKRPDALPPEQGGGGAFKCTFCYDRQIDGLTPACAKVCPTESIRFGPLDELRDAAADRVETLRERGYRNVRVYDPLDTSVGGAHALFLILGDPEEYGLPPRPEIPSTYLRRSWTSAVITSAALLVAVFLSFFLV